MDSNQTNSASTKSRKMDLYARAAAVLYGIIGFDDFFKILDSYYGEGVLSKKRITSYFRATKNDDPVYYIQDKLIIHASIPPDEVARTLSEIQHPVGVTTPARRRILPEKEFLQYADPFFYEDTSGTRKMEAHLTGDLGLSREDAREIVRETVWICRTGACPTYINTALDRRGFPSGPNSELDLLLFGIEIARDTRQWERLGATGTEMG